MNCLFIAFYTKDTPYEEEISNLIQSLERFKLPYFIKGFKNRGSWVRNAGIKPEFIYDMMGENLDKDIVYVDSDAIIQQYPKFFDTIDGDFGIHIRPVRNELLSGTIYAKNNAKMRMFMRCWIHRQTNNPDIWDQKTLHYTLGTHGRKLKIKQVQLPASYTQIFDTMKDQGPPVIEHFQASRRFKALIKSDNPIQPRLEIKELGININIRRLADNSFFLARRHPDAERYLDKHYVRVPNELRWYPKHNDSIPLDALKHYFKDQECYIVGKGPSLDFLTEKDFKNPDAPVIAINEAVHKVESLNIPNKIFAIQQDSWLKTTCLPDHSEILLCHTCAHHYEHIKNKYVFFPQELGIPKANLTVIYALALAKKFGTTGYYLISFDACVNAEIEYAKCIGYDPSKGGDPTRFLDHKKAIVAHLNGLKAEWIIPTSLDAVVYDKLGQLLPRPVAHHDHAHG